MIMVLQILSLILALGNLCEAARTNVREASLYKYLALEMHNEIRANHSSKPMELDHQLCHIAAQCAASYANNDTNPFSCGKRHRLGENYIFRQKSRTANDTIRVAMEIWYDTRYLRYDYDAPKYDKLYRTFPQVVWNESTKLGCGVQSRENITIAVCLYAPKGVTKGRKLDFAGNVQRPKHDDYQLLALDIHNKLRAKHNSKAMEHNKTLTKLAVECAQDYADNTDDDGNIRELCGKKFQLGETGFNINARRKPIDMIENTKTFYEQESKRYDYTYAGYDVSYETFTQIIWDNSTQLGCGYAFNQREQRTISVCLYYPPGNTPDDKDAFEKNVKRPIKSK